VSALSPGVPEGISEALGGGRTFVAGAGIKEFGKMTSGKPRAAGLLPLLLKNRREQQASDCGDSWNGNSAADWNWRWQATTALLLLMRRSVNQQ
jgi:hypothetical protein